MRQIQANWWGKKYGEYFVRIRFSALGEAFGEGLLWILSPARLPIPPPRQIFKNPLYFNTLEKGLFG